MNPTREDALVELAMEKPTSQRSAFLDVVCGGNVALRMGIDARLRAHDQVTDRATDPATESPPAMTAAAPPDEFAEIADKSIGRYKILEKVGEGGCGVVYVAEQTSPVRRRVALKVIKLGMDTKAVVARFEAERQALAMMDHPNIARVLDAGATEQGRPYFVMELVRGIRITDYCDQHKLSTRERLDLFIKVCQAIQHAHQKGIIHRDIKPSNILVTLHDGVPVPKVIDFGIAKATEGRLSDQTVYTQLHQFIGTPAYMSPEQAEMSGLDIDTRSDIYSLGVLLYELLTGRTPFDAVELASQGLDAMRLAIREKEPTRPSTKLCSLNPAELTTTAMRRGADAPKLVNLIRGDLDWIAMKCLEKDRTRRYETANGLAVELTRYLNDEPVAARPPSSSYRFQKWARRNKLVFGSTAAVLLALLLGISFSTWQAVRATRANHDAEIARKGEETQRLEAQQKQAQAEAAEANEKELRRIAQVQAYAADMKAAQAALQQNSRQQAVTLLNHYWPKRGEPDLRGVEWCYLSQAVRGNEIYTWKLPGMVAGAFFPRDGREIATACFDGMIRIFNVASGKQVSQFDRGVSDDDELISFCYAPDGATLVTAARDGIAVLDCATWQVKRTVPLPEAERAELKDMSLTYSPDGQWLAAASVRRGVLRLWNTASWESFTLPTKAAGRIIFSPDSRTLALGSPESGIELWDVATRSKQMTLEQPAAIPATRENGCFLMRFSPQGDRLVAATFTGFVAMWDLHSRQTVFVEQAHHSLVYGLAFSHDGKHFASGGFDQVIHIWDAATQKEVLTLKGHLNEIWSLEFSPDDRYLLTSSKDGTVKLWDAQAQPAPDHWMLEDGEWPIGFTPDGRGVFSVTADGATLRQWNGPQVIKSLPCPCPLVQTKTAFVAGSQSLYVLGANSEVQVFDAGTLRLKRSLKLSGPCDILQNVSPDERWLVGRGATSANLSVWGIGPGQSIVNIPGFEGRSYGAGRAIFSPDSRLLAFATPEWEIKLWDIANQRFLRTLGPHPWIVYNIRFSPDGRYVASSSWAGDIRICDVVTGKEVMPPLYGGGSGVGSLSFSANGATLVSASDDYTVRFWNVATGREMLLFEHCNNQVSPIPLLSPTDELLVYKDVTKNFRVRVTAIPILAEIEKSHAAESTTP